jgi:hypothetical protein
MPGFSGGTGTSERNRGVLLFTDTWVDIRLTLFAVGTVTLLVVAAAVAMLVLDWREGRRSQNAGQRDGGERREDRADGRDGRGRHRAAVQRPRGPSRSVTGDVRRSLGAHAIHRRRRVHSRTASEGAGRAGR